MWGGTLLEVGANKHNGEVTDLSAIRESRNDVLFQTADARVLTDEQVGGFGRDLIDQRDNKAIRASLQRTWRNHTFKGGAEWNRSDNFRDTLYVNGSGFTTLADKYRGAGITAAQIAAGGWTGLQFDVSTTSDFNGLIRTIDGSSRSRRVLQRLRHRSQRHGDAGRARRQPRASAMPTRTASACSTIATSRPRPARRKPSRRA